VVTAGDDRAIVLNAETAEDNNITGRNGYAGFGRFRRPAVASGWFYRMVAVVPVPDIIYAPQRLF
jgi:hypothetical protein